MRPKSDKSKEEKKAEGARLKSIREALRLTRKEFSPLLGLESDTQLKSLELGNTQIPSLLLEVLKLKYNIPKEYILEGSEMLNIDLRAKTHEEIYSISGKGNNQTNQNIEIQTAGGSSNYSERDLSITQGKYTDASPAEQEVFDLIIKNATAEDLKIINLLLMYVPPAKKDSLLKELTDLKKLIAG